MKLLLATLLLITLTNADTLNQYEPSKLQRIQALEAELNSFKEAQADINLYQSALNSNQTELNTELKEQIKALQLRLNKLEKK